MISRRTFFGGVTGSVTALVGGVTLTARATAREPSPNAVSAFDPDHPTLHLAIFDHRFAAGRRFARSNEARGIATRPVTSDVTDLWYFELHPLWKRQPVAIAGLTTYGPLFCLERLAWDHGMRVLHREQHGAPVEAAATGRSRTTAIAGGPHQPLYSWIIAPATPPHLEYPSR